ncbi:probable sodium/metabolite cotransporter BASS2, chloroplastic [Phalaenopsis equestris]|uniref:probable sodium/metabolite cotransporter BASS2, chloroplastic n=1 Tax=Phalaenopsis equestris TaxID=78828 RepID=UPI0009E469A5|nr:probable sodium/metabolite cotransporter BASS2, chloroplastic [Phalaenopsis equestris]
MRRRKRRDGKCFPPAASLYPLYVTAGGAIACFRPSAFSWFVNGAPLSYSCSLGFIMLVMGVTLELNDLLGVLRQKPFSVLFGCLAQYTIMPAFGAIVSRALCLPASLSVGLILLACCPGGTASNVVTLIARGDVPLSIVMTVCTTLAAVLLTPFLTKILAGTYVPVDAAKLSLSTLQVVVIPTLIGSYMQSRFPSSVKLITPFAPLLAVLASSLLASSVFSENVVRLKSSIIDISRSFDQGFLYGLHGILSGELGLVILSILLLHFVGFFVGYLAAAVGGFREKQRRAISIEVGMQNSSLGVVLATSHFSSPMVALPAALSAVIMNIMGSTLGLIWRYIEPQNGKEASTQTKAD